MAKGINGSIPFKAHLATWRSGYAAACKAVYTGSIPVVASLSYRRPLAGGQARELRPLSITGSVRLLELS
jgi:hypothetical protein